MNLTTKSLGLALTLAAAGMVSGCNNTKPDTMASTADSVKCFGVNKCGGHNDCKTASNSCKGKASCQGKGFLKMSKSACDKVGGTVNT
jgi:uncharacterized membrane protein